MVAHQFCTCKWHKFFVHRQVPEDHVAPFYLDLEDHSSIAQAATSILEVFGRVDILINNAGVGCSSPVQYMTLEMYKKVMDINYFGQVELTRSKCSCQ